MSDKPSPSVLLNSELTGKPNYKFNVAICSRYYYTIICPGASVVKPDKQIL